MRSVQKLGTGFKRFRREFFAKNPSLFKKLSRGQRPKNLIISCSDSRVDPAIVFDARPGELFIVRNVANLVPPYNPDGGVHGVSAALEFAVRNLEVENVIVLGHSQCGGIMALLGDHKGEFISRWMDTAESAKKEALKKSKGKSQEIKQRNCEFAAIKLSYNNLMTFPWIKEKVKKKKLSIFAWYFDLQRGEIRQYDPGRRTFKLLK